MPCSRQSRTPTGARICLNPPGAAGTACTTTSTPTTPMNARNSEPCEKEESADALTVLTGATAEEEEGTRDAGKTVAHVQAGVTNLARTAGVTNLARTAGVTHLARGTGGISLVRIAHIATQACCRCRLSQEGMKTATKTRGLGASRSLAPSPASWAELKPQPLNVSSSSLLVK